MNSRKNGLPVALSLPVDATYRFSGANNTNNKQTFGETVTLSPPNPLPVLNDVLLKGPDIVE